MMDEYQYVPVITRPLAHRLCYDKVKHWKTHTAGGICEETRWVVIMKGNSTLNMCHTG